MNSRRIAAMIAACLLAVGAAFAAPPPLLNYQGVLRDASGDPRNGTFNMTFRFFDAPLAGSEMLVDTHAGAQGVAVSSGLFNAQLGGGLVSPGGGATNFPSLDQMFRAKDNVWLEIVIGGETLAPRVRVLSSAYALNAAAVGGVGSDSFLRSDASDTYTSGTLTAAAGTIIDVKGDLRLNGSLSMDSDGPDGAQAIYFYNSGNPTGASLQWDDANNRFYSSNGLYVNGALSTAGFASIGGPQVVVGANGPDQDQIVAFYEDGIPQGEYLQWDDSDDLFHLSDDLRVNGDVTVSGDRLFMGGAGAETTQLIDFFNNGSATGETLGWDDAQDRFELTDELAIGGPLRVGSTATAPVTYSTIGSGTPASADITVSSDLFVAADLEVASQLYLGANDYLEGLSPSGIRASTTFHSGGELIADGNRLWLDFDGLNMNTIEYFVPTDEFQISTNVDIFGSLEADVKNFVQNHPLDPSLSIVYTTLEGPEASAFTRGSARLEQGAAHVKLDETFAWVAHPDLGLTVSLTPRGGWSNLYVESVTTSELVVRGTEGTAPDAAFDYLVLGLRVGYEELPAVRPRTREAKLPTVESLHAQIQERPELARYTPLTQYQKMQRAVTGHEVTNFSASDALRQAVGVGRSGSASHDAAVAEMRAMRTPERREAPAATAGDTTIVKSATRATSSASAANTRPAATATAPGTSDVVAADAPADPFAALRASAVRFDEVSPSVGDVAAGDVLSLDASGAVRRADTESDTGVVGIAASQPIPGQDGAPMVAMALSGIVTCRVDASFGEIQRGTLLVSSPNPGHAMRADAPRPGTILGKALDPLPSGVGTIRVLVTLR